MGYEEENAGGCSEFNTYVNICCGICGYLFHEFRACRKNSSVIHLASLTNMNNQLLSYNQLVAKYGEQAFTAACQESKHSPLSVQAILERNANLAKTAEAIKAAQGNTAPRYVQFAGRGTRSFAR